MKSALRVVFGVIVTVFGLYAIAGWGLVRFIGAMSVTALGLFFVVAGVMNCRRKAGN